MYNLYYTPERTIDNPNPVVPDPIFLETEADLKVFLYNDTYKRANGDWDLARDYYCNIRFGLTICNQMDCGWYVIIKY